MMIEAAATAPKTRRRGFAMMTGDPRYVCAIIDEKHDIGRYIFWIPILSLSRCLSNSPQPEKKNRRQSDLLAVDDQ